MNIIKGMIKDLRREETHISGCTTNGELIIALESLERCVELPYNATNGDAIKAMFPNLECVGEREDTKSYILEPDDLLSPKLIAFNSWWNASYKAESGVK